jgi:hypothetical protein
MFAYRVVVTVFLLVILYAIPHLLKLAKIRGHVSVLLQQVLMLGVAITLVSQWMKWLGLESFQLRGEVGSERSKERKLDARGNRIRTCASDFDCSENEVRTSCKGGVCKDPSA